MTRTTRTDALKLEELEPAWIVDGAFGLSGIYPLEDSRLRDASGRWVRSCNMWYVRLGVSEATRLKHPVVVEKTHYRLWRAETLLENEGICTACLNLACPANRNPGAVEGSWGAGTLVLDVIHSQA
jgi:hypothetical protein